MAGYDPIGSGIASAGQSIASGLQMREDRKWREKAFEEQKRQFEIGQANAAKANNMKAGSEVIENLRKLVESGYAAPEDVNPYAAIAMQSASTGEPLNFEAIAKLQQAQKNLEQPQEQFEQASPSREQASFINRAQMQGAVQAPFQAPEMPEQTGLAQTTPETQSRIGTLSPAYEPPKVFPTLYDRVSAVANPKAVQVRALKPHEQIRLFREKPVNFDSAVKDGMEKGYVIPAKAGAYYEAKLLGKSD